MANLTPWDPFGEVFSIRDTVNRMFGNQIWQRQPTVDVIDRKQELVLRADLPGMEQKDIEVVVDEDSVMLKGALQTEQEQTAEDFYRRERAVGSFTRTIPLNVPVKPEEAQATFKNGLLEVVMPKADHARPRARRLEIQ